MKPYATPRPKSRSPLGAYVAKFLSTAYDNATLLGELFGEERAATLLNRIGRLKLSDLEGGGAKLGRQATHESNAPHVGRFLAFVALVLEQCARHDNKRACSRQLYQGRSRRWDPEAKRVVYVQSAKGAQAGGLASRLGVSVREVQRYARLGELVGLFSRRQVKQWESVEKLPRSMRGKRWSYGLYTWAGDVPRAAVAAVQAWWGRTAPREQLTAALPERERTRGSSSYPASFPPALVALLPSLEPEPSS